ncbi:ABC transporter permease [Streptosporangium amethystogenes]|uniref:ABC transporter permease n=1 Tax=Streptosporangium amethystogenes TaxID=2002 RepID=UPI0004C7076C|nr:ABC transporter permease [Streptosporangium amethystogenes]
MWRLMVTRLCIAVPMLVLVSTATFFLGILSPIDPAEFVLGPDPSQEQVDLVRKEMGLDRPVLTQFQDWASGALHGDLGRSLFTDEPVARLLVQALPVTLSLTLGGLVVSLLVGIPAGVWSGIRAGRAGDRVVTGLVTIGQAVPHFWLALLLILAFAVHIKIFPAVGYVSISRGTGQWLNSIALPSIALGTAGGAVLARQTRSAVIGVLQQEYIRTALAQGLPRRRVVFKFALKNAAIPIVTVIAFEVAGLFSGSIVIERMFSMQGIGSLTVDAVLRRDPDVIQGVIVVAATIMILIQLALDLSYAWLNPKVRPI